MVKKYGSIKFNENNSDDKEDNKFFDMLSEMQNRKNLTFKQFKDYLNRSKFFDKLESELKKAKKIDMESVLKKKRETYKRQIYNMVLLNQLKVEVLK